MQTMNISRPEKLKAEERLEALLLKGLNSEETVLAAADWKAIRMEALANHAQQ